MVLEKFLPHQVKNCIFTEVGRIEWFTFIFPIWKRQMVDFSTNPESNWIVALIQWPMWLFSLFWSKHNCGVVCQRCQIRIIKLSIWNKNEFCQKESRVLLRHHPFMTLANFHNVRPVPPSNDNFFITISQQIWPIFESSPIRNADVLNWTVLLLFIHLYPEWELWGFQTYM